MNAFLFYRTRKPQDICGVVSHFRISLERYICGAFFHNIYCMEYVRNYLVLQFYLTFAAPAISRPSSAQGVGS